jgi:DNA repair protein RadC
MNDRNEKPLFKVGYPKIFAVFFNRFACFNPVRIHDLPESIRPRERGFRHGVGFLSDAELIAILIRCGRKGMSALEMSQSLLRHVDGSLEELRQCEIEALTLNGLGKVQALTLLAALETGFRARECFRTPKTLEEALVQVMQSLSSMDRETFFVIPLDLRNRCIGFPIALSKGSRYQVVVDPKDVLHAAISRKAGRVGVVHNHPSQDVQPSPQDLLLTKQLMEACAWVDIEFLDHWIVTKKEKFSFRENGLLD